MRYLLDTNVISELRKGRRANAGVIEWFRATPGPAMFLSVVVLGEVRRGIENLRRRDPSSADALDGWLATITAAHEGRILVIDEAIADRWGRLNVPDPLPASDGLLAATALVHGMTLVTRNTRDVARTGVAVLDPFV